MDKTKSTPSLWTKDFTIITVGSAVSMLGTSMAGFAMSLLVLDYTQSNFLYAIYIAVYTLPQIIMPIFSGAYLDRFSRRKTIYTLDFISAGLYGGAAILLNSGWFNFPVLAVFCFLLGSINSIYTVAYQSFYPLLITEGNYSKAYSMSSLLETLSAVMIPVATFAYNITGIAPLLAINAATFFIAAVMETKITAVEEYIDLRKSEEHADFQNGNETSAHSEIEKNTAVSDAPNSSLSKTTRMFFTDIKEGILYLAKEKGLLAITIYFTITAFAGGASSVITLPYFKTTFENGEYVYMLVWGMAVLGRGLGSAIHYRIKYPSRIKYATALTVYLITTLQEAFYLYTNIPIMMGCCLLSGILGVTSYTIRISSTQNYVPDEKKGRYNGAFNMLTTIGCFAGEMLAGVLTVVVSARTVLTGFLLLNAVAALIVVGGNKKEISKIYNREL